MKIVVICWLHSPNIEQKGPHIKKGPHKKKKAPPPRHKEKSSKKALHIMKKKCF